MVGIVKIAICHIATDVFHSFFRSSSDQFTMVYLFNRGSRHIFAKLRIGSKNDYWLTIVIEDSIIAGFREDKCLFSSG